MKNATKIRIYSFVIMCLFLINTISCKKDVEKPTPVYSAPTVTTNIVDGVTDIQAHFSGNVISDGGSVLDEVGFCWSTERSPDINDDHSFQSGQDLYGESLDNFDDTEYHLLPNTKYYVRATAINNRGLRAYSNEVTFKTETGGGGGGDLNGVWDYGTFEITISGSGGRFSEINSGPWLSALNGGFISATSYFLMFIDKTGNNVWSCTVKWFHATNGVVDKVFDSSLGTITLSNDGTYFTLYSEATYNGIFYTESGTFTRKQKNVTKSTLPILNTSHMSGLATCSWY